MSRNSLKAMIVGVKVNNNYPMRRVDTSLEDYADLGDVELPKDASVQIADQTGYSVGRYTAGEYDHPDLGELTNE